MNQDSVARAIIALSVLLFASRVAHADCVISGMRPTVPLPTMADGQEFSFLASADCETLRFRVVGTALTKIPKAGAGTGSGVHTYKVVLTEREWNSVVDESDPTFTWSIVGTTSAGVTTRVTTTNELKLEGVTLDLSMADVKLVCEKQSDQVGESLSGAGDVDGDGHDDVLIGAFGYDNGDVSTGAAYLVLGPMTGTVDLALADARLLGSKRHDDAGSSVSGAGDVDGDGRDDLLIGAVGRGGASDEGAAYLVLGPVTGTLDLSHADAWLVGQAGDHAGFSVSGAGDVNGDGDDDLLVGAVRSTAGGDWAGAAYLVLGPVTGVFDLSLADAQLAGEEAGDGASRVSGAGDVDGDGDDDLLVGAPYNSEDGGYAGAAYLVLGPVTGTIDLSLAGGKLVGEETYDYAGGSISGAGDVNGDGRDDLLIGAEGNDEGGSSAGAAYLVLGPVTGTRDLGLANGKVVGEEMDDAAGISVSDAGDVDGDGHDDLLVGAHLNDEGRTDAGAAYLVLGPVTGTLDLSLADAKLVGEQDSDAAGYCVSGAGDVDGDGLDDLLVGAYWWYSKARSAYLVYGGGLF